MKKFASVVSLIVIITVVACIIREKEDIQPSNKKLKPNASDHKDSERTNDHSSKNNRDHESSDTEARIQKMFKDLGMTADQQRRYEADYKSVMAQWEKENPNKSIEDHERAKQLERTLDAILDEAQFSIYREWSKNNA